MKKTAKRKLERAEKKLIKSTEKWLKDWDALCKEPDPPQSDTMAVVSQNMKAHSLFVERISDIGAEFIDFVRAFREAKK